jgi:tetratricopeptide (TPR) repeat protein
MELIQYSKTSFHLYVLTFSSDDVFTIKYRSNPYKEKKEMSKTELASCIIEIINQNNTNNVDEQMTNIIEIASDIVQKYYASNNECTLQQLSNQVVKEQLDSIDTKLDDNARKELAHNFVNCLFSSVYSRNVGANELSDEAVNKHCQEVIEYVNDFLNNNNTNSTAVNALYYLRATFLFDALITTREFISDPEPIDKQLVQQAISDFEWIEKSSSTINPFYYQVAALLTEIGELEKAQQLLNRALETDPDNIDLIGLKERMEELLQSASGAPTDSFDGLSINGSSV